MLFDIFKIAYGFNTLSDTVGRKHLKMMSLLVVTFFLCCFLSNYDFISAFSHQKLPNSYRISSLHALSTEAKNADSNFFSDSITKINNGIRNGDNFKQIVADVIAGDFDIDAITSKADSLTKSAPVVIFSWTMSPACKKAKKLLDRIGVKYSSIELDQPWDEGNILR